MKKTILLIVLIIIGIIVYYAVIRGGRLQVSSLVQSGQVYADAAQDFTVRLPIGYRVDDQYTNTISPGRTFQGVKFTAPLASTTGTNLSQDSGVSIEHVSVTSTSTPCVADSFMDMQGQKSYVITDGDLTYSVASTTGAGAGNRYEEIVYVPQNSGGKCLAIRYFIHSTVFENYPEGTITRFDREALIRQFDSIRHSFKWL